MKLSMLFAACLFVCQSSLSYAVTGIDVRYEDHTNGDTTFKLVGYDVSNQRLKFVTYIRGKGEALDHHLEDAFPKDVAGIEIMSDGSVVLGDDFDPKSFLVRVQGEIDTHDLDVQEEDYKLFDINGYGNRFDKRYDGVYRTCEIEYGKTVIDRILKGSTSSVTRGNDFPVTVSNSRGVHTLRSINNDERGEIGEIITELTMLSFGYDQLVSKYEHNHGLDGVFVDRSQDPEFFITQSKCWGAAVAAAKTMEKELNESYMYERIQTGLQKRGPIRSSMKMTHNFILKKPGKVFKFAHRTALTGKSQGAFAFLNYGEYQSLSGIVPIETIRRQIQRLSLEDRQRLRNEL